MTRDGNCINGAALLLALIVGALTLTCTARAVQATTTPNAGIGGYTLAAGANSGLFTPAANQPVLVMGTCTTVGNRGVGHVTMLRTSIAPMFLEWSGVESPAAAAITSGFSSAVGTHIVYLDFSHQVDIEVASVSQFRVHNGSGVAQTGYVTMIW
jgi:hypothetical protein